MDSGINLSSKLTTKVPFSRLRVKSVISGELMSSVKVSTPNA